MDARKRLIEDALRLARESKANPMQGFAIGGMTKAKKAKKAKGKTHEGRVFPVIGDELTPFHPAMNIPGVHIRTAEAGEPIFHGDE